MVTIISEYQYDSNLPIAQLVINFFQDDIVIIGQSFPSHSWYEISGKKQLLESSFQTHEFGFFQFGQGLITDLTDNAEFLRYVLGKIQKKIPLVLSSFSSINVFTHTLVYEYSYDDKLQAHHLEFNHKKDFYLHANDLIGIKSLVYHVLKEFHDREITYTNLLPYQEEEISE